MQKYNIYCDESCHLENDDSPIMALGAVWCPEEERVRLSQEISNLKSKFNAKGELKWTKVSKSKTNFYIELVNWFFSEKSLHFRAVIILNKKDLDHKIFNNGSHDNFYYKMYFSLINKILSPVNIYNIYIDIKDTKSRKKNKELKNILCNDVHDFTGQMINKIQNIHSHDSNLSQLVDFLLGALTYKNRKIESNDAKINILNLIESKIKFGLTTSTPLKEDKFNLFFFTPRLVNNN